MHPSLAHNFLLMDDKVSDCLVSFWSKATVIHLHPAHLTYHRCAPTIPMKFEKRLSSDSAAEQTLDSSGIPWRQIVARCCYFLSDIDHTDHISFTDVADDSRRQFIVYLRTSKSRLSSRGREQFSSCDCRCHCHAKSHVSLQTYLLVFRRHRNHHRPLHHHHHHHYQHRPSPTATGLKRQPETPPSAGGPEPSATDRQRPRNLETTVTCHQAPHQDRNRDQGIADERRQELCRRLHRHVDSLVGRNESRIKSVQDGSRNHCYSPLIQPGCYPTYSVGSGIGLPSPCCRNRGHYPKTPGPSAARVWPVPLSSIVWSIYRSETDGREFRLYILHVPTSALSSSSSRISNFLTDSRSEFATGIMMMMMMMMKRRRRRRKRRTTTTMTITIMIITTAAIMVMIEIESEIVPLVRFCRIFCDLNSLGVADVLVATAAAVVDDANVFESPVNHGQAPTALGILRPRPSDQPGLSLRLAEFQCSSSALSSSSTTSSSTSFPSSSLLSSPLSSSPSSSSASKSNRQSEVKSIAVPSSTVNDQEHRIEASSSHNDDSDFNDRDDTDHTDHKNVIDVNCPGRPSLDSCGRDLSTSSDMLMPCFSILFYQLLLVVIFICRKWRKGGTGVCRFRGDSSRKDQGRAVVGSRKKQVSRNEDGTSSSSLNRTSDPPILRGSRQGVSRKSLGGGRGLGNIWSLPVLFCLAFSLYLVDGGKVAEVSEPHLGPNPGIRHVPRHFHLRNLCSSRYLTISTTLPTASADNLVPSTNITAESMGPHSLIRMRNRLNYYLCFDREGIMKAKKHPDETCNFFEIHTRDHKTEFLSSFNLTWYVGFDRTGCPLAGGSRLMSRIRKSHKWIESESTRLKRPRNPSNRAAFAPFEARVRKAQRRQAALAAIDRQSRGVTGNVTTTAENKTVRIRHQRQKPKNANHTNHNNHNNRDNKLTPIKRKSTKEFDRRQQRQQNQHRRRHATKDRKSQNENRKRKCPVSHRERKLPDKCFQFVKDAPRPSPHHHPHQSPSSKN